MYKNLGGTCINLSFWTFVECNLHIYYSPCKRACYSSDIPEPEILPRPVPFWDRRRGSGGFGGIQVRRVPMRAMAMESASSIDAMVLPAFQPDVMLKADQVEIISPQDVAPVQRTRKLFPETWLWKSEQVQYVYCLLIYMYTYSVVLWLVDVNVKVVHKRISHWHFFLLYRHSYSCSVKMYNYVCLYTILGNL